ncbi:ADA32 protein, partial [Penelope pileata]|nr:ADA32 protein [Penelope pileata]
DTLSYVLAVEGKPYTIRLQQQFFLPGDFRIYTYNKNGSLLSDLPYVQSNCYYRGDIEGVPGSAVTLSACAGLRGLLQFPNASYGIEPLGSSPTSQHVVYPMGSRGALGPLLTHSHPESGRDVLVPGGGFYEAHALLEAREAVHRSPCYLETHVILDKALYDYMGADKDAVTARVVQLFSYVNSMLARLNLTIVLSSLELWTEENKIPTTGDAEELLQRFLQWKDTHRVLRLHNIMFLFVYREQSHYEGASAGKLCLRSHAGGVALYPRAMELEAFSVAVVQLLGLSLGMSYDDPGSCHCTGTACVMQSSAVNAAGAKAFSSCSVRDFERFLASEEGQCLLNRPSMTVSYRAPVCGNKVVEPGEACDCGSAEECRRDPCCSVGCMAKKGTQCQSGPCCRKCKFMRKGTPCIASSEDECELKEYCNGTSAACPTNLWVMDGHPCSENTAFCYKGVCQIADKQCQEIFGKGAKNGPLSCYEEINGRRDRMGHCGSDSSGYHSCAWRDLRCGKLICQYPGSMPFTKEKAAVVYARVQGTLCVTLDYMQPRTEKDPMLVRDGTVCGDQKVCMKQKCVSAAVLNYSCDIKTKCHNHGVCDSQGNCHCDFGWGPPDCREKARPHGVGGGGGSGGGDDWNRSSWKMWLLLTFCVFVSILIGVIFMVKKREEL